jgi:hypothetical protein
MNLVAKTFKTLTKVTHSAYRRVLMHPRPNGIQQLSAEQIQEHLALAAEWIAAAQDAQSDGGISGGFTFCSGWLPSYPETTGYTIPTALAYATLMNCPGWRNRATRMYRFLLTQQDREEGWFPAGLVTERHRRSIFNSGMILHGFNHYYHEFPTPECLDVMLRCGRWICHNVDPEGTWGKYNVNNLQRTYNAEVSASLAELYDITKEPLFKTTVQGCNDWILKQQLPNGWYSNCDNTEKLNDQPLTHLIGYTLRGLLVGGKRFGNDAWVNSGQKALDAILTKHPLESGVLLDGRLDANWAPRLGACCVTGVAQIAIALFLLNELRPNPAYLQYARGLNAQVAQIQEVANSHPGFRGGLPSSFPVWGGYERFCFNNWGIKYFMDALMLDLRSRGGS